MEANDETPVNYFEKYDTLITIYSPIHHVHKPTDFWRSKLTYSIANVDCQDYKISKIITIKKNTCHSNGNFNAMFDLL